MDMDAHTLNVFLPAKVRVNARQSVCFYFPQTLLRKIKAVLLPQISLYLKVILQKVYGSLFILDRCKEVSLNFCQ